MCWRTSVHAPPTHVLRERESKGEAGAVAMDIEAMARPRCAPDPRHVPEFYEMADEELAGRYLLMHGIGSGKYGKVYEGRDVATGHPVAIKVMPRSPHIDHKKAEREWVIANKLNHPNVIRLLDVQLSPSHTFLVLELACGRALFDIVQRENGLSEDRARRIAFQIFSGMDYCHRQGVSHRDLKLENLLMMRAEEGDGTDGFDDTIKITDFGLSKDSLTSNCRTQCGTLCYMAPEVALADVQGPYEGSGVDIWSMGVILYVMRCASYPFGHDGKSDGAETPVQIFKRIKAGTFKNPEQFRERCSADLQSLIRGMLTVDPANRFGFAEIQAHPWMQPVIQEYQAAALGREPAAEPRLAPVVDAPQGAGALEDTLTVVWTPIDEGLRHQSEEAPPHVGGAGSGAAYNAYHDAFDYGPLDSVESLGMLDADDAADLFGPAFGQCDSFGGRESPPLPATPPVRMVAGTAADAGALSCEMSSMTLST